MADTEQRMRQLIEDALSSLAPGDVQALAQRLATGGLPPVEQSSPRPRRSRRGGDRGGEMR